jgi:TP901 family phage tail tape measure protein
VARSVSQITIPIKYLTNTKALTDAESKLGKFGGIVAGVAAAATAAVAGIGVAAVKMAAEFETSFAKIQGLVGVSKQDLGELQEAAARLAPAFGKSAQEAADALFFITSAGLRGKDAIDVLEASLKGSAIGLGDMTQLANAATAAVNTFGADVLTGSQAVDAIAEAVRLGQFAPEELAGAIGRILPISNELGISLQETLGLVAGLTRGGLNAAESITGLRGAYQAFLKPSAEAERTLANFGFSIDDVQSMITEKGFLATLTELRTAFGDNDQAVTEVFGSIEGLNSVLALTGANLTTNQDIVAQMTDKIGVLDEAFEITAQTGAFKFASAMETAKTALLPVGDTLLKIGADLLDSLMPTIEKLGPVFSETFESFGPALDDLFKLLPELIDAFLPVLPLLGDIASIVLDLASALLPPFVTLLQALMPIFTMLTDVVAALVVPLVEMLAPVLDDIFGSLGNILEAALPVFIKLLEAVIPIVLELVEMFLPLLDYVLPLLETYLTSLVIPALDLFASILGVVLPAAMAIFMEFGLGRLITFLGSFADDFARIVYSIRERWAESFNSMIESLETWLNTAIRGLNWFIQKANSLPGVQIDFQMSEISLGRIKLGGEFDNLTFGSVDTTGISDVHSRPNTLGGSTSFGSSNSFISGTAQQRGFYTDQFGNQIFGNIPQMADGGIVTRPIVGMIGEAGPEAIIPLSKANRMGNTYNITVNAGMGTDGSQVGEQIVNAIKRYERTSGPVFAKA